MWTARENSRLWFSVTSSADGEKLAAVIGDTDGIGFIFTSSDAGVTWTPRDAERHWYSVASSADGTKLVAAELYGHLFTSTDSGVTWSPSESNRTWDAVACSADGNKLFATERTGSIYTSVPPILFSGGQDTALELLCTGAGQWRTLSQQGTITSY
jgi:photosystem II stability/assembly factor-like uncharacterized protein